MGKHTGPWARPGRGTAMRRLWPAALLVLVSLVYATAALAHVDVTPHQSAPGAAEQYTVTVPTERVVPTVKVRMLIPAGLVVYSYAAAPGWQRELEEDGSGRVTGIIWSGGLILPGEYAQFGFQARNPPVGPLIWKAYQTYQDGLVVAWTGPLGSEQPAAVTALSGAAAPAGSASATAGDSSLLPAAALVIAALALALATLNCGLLILALRRRIL